MSDLESEDPPRLGGRLLAPARSDAPSSASRARVAGALGVGATATIATTKAAAASATTAKVAGIGLWTKVVGVAAVTLAVGGGAVSATADAPIAQTTPSAQTGLSLGAASASESTRARRDEIPPPEPLAPPPSANLGEPSPPVARVERVTTPSVGASTNDEPSPLAREVRAIEVARSALVAGQPRSALVALDQHDRDFPNGPMRTEADVLRVDALEASGDHPDAKRLASQLLARDPSGAHARHLRTVVGEK